MINLPSKQLLNLEDLLINLEEYMEPKAEVEITLNDIDCSVVPNTEMKLLVRIQEALKQLKTKVA